MNLSENALLFGNAKIDVKKEQSQELIDYAKRLPLFLREKVEMISNHYLFLDSPLNQEDFYPYSEQIRIQLSPVYNKQMLEITDLILLDVLLKQGEKECYGEFTEQLPRNFKLSETQELEDAKMRMETFKYFGGLPQAPLSKEERAKSPYFFAEEDPYVIQEESPADQSSHTLTSYEQEQVKRELLESNSSYKLKKEEGRNIGVLGLSRQSGTTFCALNLAKALAEQGSDVTFMEIPEVTEGSLYESYHMDKKLQFGFYDYVQNIADNTPLFTNERNLYKGINFYIPRETYPDWKDSYTFKMLYSSPGTNVVDIGYHLADILNKGLINVFTHLVMVIDLSLVDEFMTELRMFKSLAMRYQFKPIYIVNRCTTERFLQSRHFFPDLSIRIQIKDYHYTQLEPFHLDKREMESLSMPFAVNKIKRMEVPITVNYLSQHAIEIAILSASKGAGATYNAILCAGAIKSDYKVAIIELNESGHFLRLHQQLEDKKQPNGKKFSYLGIDYYYATSYSDFSKRYKNDYDYILLDYGEYSMIPDLNELIRCNYKFVIAQGIDWKLPDLSKCYEYLSQYDLNNSYLYFIPCIDESNLRDIKKEICYGNKVLAITYHQNPFYINEAISKTFRSALQLSHKKKLKK